MHQTHTKLVLPPVPLTMLTNQLISVVVNQILTVDTAPVNTKCLDTSTNTAPATKGGTHTEPLPVFALVHEDNVACCHNVVCCCGCVDK